MKKFILLYYAPQGAQAQMQNNDPQDMEKAMAQWQAWAGKCGKHMIDLGNPLGDCDKVSTKEVTKGNMNIAGYSIMQAESIETIKELLEGHPHLDDDRHIEVHEAIPMGM